MQHEAASVVDEEEGVPLVVVDSALEGEKDHHADEADSEVEAEASHQEGEVDHPDAAFRAVEDEVEASEAGAPDSCISLYDKCLICTSTCHVTKPTRSGCCCPPV